MQETLQAFAYAGDDPVNETDPTGLRGGPAAGMALAADKACGYDGSRDNSVACKAFELHLAAYEAAMSNGVSVFTFLLEMGPMVAVGILTDGVGDVALADLEGTTTLGEALDSATAATRGGESAAAAYGRAMHAAWDYGPGFEKEFTLANGVRADAVNLAEREVIELKPDNPSAIARGLRQAEAYAEQLTKQFPGKPFTYRVITYQRP